MSIVIEKYLKNCQLEKRYKILKNSLTKKEKIDIL